MKIDGLEITPKQFEKITAVATNPSVVAKRKVITMYKANDAGLALFRTQATNHIAAIMVRAVLNKPLKVAQASYVNKWLVDRNPMFAEFFAALNEAVGYDFIQGVPK